jgi:Kdo2-lipid IVA lauroyltransferase/acyltransferase
MASAAPARRRLDPRARKAGARTRRDRRVARLLSGLAWLFSRVSWRTAQALGARLGRVAAWIARRDRRRSLEHLAIAFPEATPRERKRLAHASFDHFGRTLGECLHLLSQPASGVERHATVEGWEHLEATRALGRPLIVLTGHCGNWELLAALINVRGLGMRVVARELETDRLQALLLGLRERFGTRTIERGGPGAARELLSTLRSGGALGMLIDQDTKVDGVWVPFFGRPAYTPVGAAKMAAKLGAVVHPAFIERQVDGHHLVRFLPALDLPADPVAATARMTETIEAQIRRRPEQWVWMHRRWRRQVESGHGP